MVGPPPSSWSIDPAKVETYEVRPGLWQLRLPLAWPDISHVNSFLLERPDGGVTLVDCGSAGDESCWQALEGAIAATGHAVADVRDLVITHAHSDHFGLARRVVDGSGCTMWMHPAHEAFSDGMDEPERVHAARGRRALREGVPPDLAHLYADVREETDGCLAPLPTFEPLRDGMSFETAHGRWVAIETPGHAPNHLVFHQPENRLLLAADLVSRIFAPWFDYGYTHDTVAEMQASFARAAELDVATALVGHGRPLEDFADVVQLHRDALTRRLEDTLAAIRQGPTHAYGLCARVFGETGTDQARVWEMVEMVAYLRHHRLTGRIVRDETGEMFSYRATG